MKKGLMVFVALLLVVAGQAWAVGTCTVGSPVRGILHGSGTGSIMVAVTCVADASAATIPDAAVTSVGGNLLAVFMDWGATAPTSGAYDIYVKADSMASADLLGGLGVNLVTTADLWITPKVGEVYVPAPFVGNLTISQAGNAVNSATPTIYLVFAP